MSVTSEVSRLGVKGEEKSTTNDWGFGGWSGKAYALPGGAVLHQGRYFYRHASPTRYLRLYLPADAQGQEPDPLSSLPKVLAYLESLPTPTPVVVERLVRIAKELTKGPRLDYTQGRLF